MLKIFNKFSPRANPADSNYPNGSIKNESVPGAKDGTPLDAEWGNDDLGFYEALVAEANITPSGAPDTAVASDRLTALKVVARNEGHNGVTLAAAVADVTLKSGQTRRLTDRGDGLFDAIPVGTTPDVDLPNTATVIASVGDPTLVLSLRVSGPISATSCGVKDAIDSKVFIQAAQDLSELHKQPIEFYGLLDIRFTGGILYDSWLEWRGSGKFDSKFTPTTKDNSVVGKQWWIHKRDNTVDVTHVLMQDIGVDGEFAGGFPTGNQFLGWFSSEADGSDDKDITFLRCHFVDIPFDVVIGRVTKASGGTIEGIRMLFCSGGTNHVGTPNRNANMFKTMHGVIGNVGLYGQYPITDIVSFGNTCTHMRSLCDFKRGSKNFSHNNSHVIDMSDVCSISVDGAADGTIGPNNVGEQTSAFADAKNFYEIQAENVDVLGGQWDANNRTGVVAGLFITNFIDVNELNPGVHDQNQSINVNCYGMTVRNISPVQSAVRLLNTIDCDVRGVKAFDIGFAAVSFEHIAGLKNLAGVIIPPNGNTVDDVREENCTLSVITQAGNKIRVGENIFNEDGQMDIDVNNIAGSGLDIEFEALYTPKELNPNQRFQSYGGAATQILGWESGTATRTFDASDKPFNSYNSLTLEDTSAAAIQSGTMQASLAVKQGDIIYFMLGIKTGTGINNSINVQEFNGVTFISNTFIDLKGQDATDWEPRLRKHKVVDASADRLIINLNPAANDNGDSTLQGTTKFADLRISDKLNSGIIRPLA